MRRALPLGRAFEIDEHPAVLDLDRKGRHPVSLEARLAEPGHAMEFPLMPRADDVVAVEMTLAQGTADMIAVIVNGAELAPRAGHRDFKPPDRHAA